MSPPREAWRRGWHWRNGMRGWHAAARKWFRFGSRNLADFFAFASAPPGGSCVLRYLMRNRVGDRQRPCDVARSTLAASRSRVVLRFQYLCKCFKWWHSASCVPSKSLTRGYLGRGANEPESLGNRTIARRTLGSAGLFADAIVDLVPPKGAQSKIAIRSPQAGHNGAGIKRVRRGYRHRRHTNTCSRRR